MMYEFCLSYLPVFTENPVVGGPYELRSFGLVEVIKFNFLTSLRNYWAILDLKQEPRDYESPALTAELMAQISRKLYRIEDFA